MQDDSVAIIIPVKNGMPHFADVCRMLQIQRYDDSIEVLCIDSGSKDGSDRLALDCGFRLERIPSTSFGHGRTRNLGAELTKSKFIAFLTHDAIPLDEYWLANLLRPLRDDENIAGAFSRHIAHEGADPFTSWELDQHFERLAEYPVVEIVDREEYDSNLALRQLYHFYSDNASAMRRSVWEVYRYPDVQFAEDQIWAKTILEAGYRKAFAYNSVVRHSHAFGPLETLRRSFDESRAFRQMFGYELSSSFRHVLRSALFLVGRDVGNAIRNGWWKSHPGKTVSRIAESFARPMGHYLGTQNRLPTYLEHRISRDEWIKSL